MRKNVIVVAAMVCATPAAAQTVALKPLVDVRARYEGVDQGGLADDADAVTVRVRAGLQATTGPWSALAEAQGNLSVLDDYYDGVHGAATRPLIGDPQNIGLYRAQVAYRTKSFALTAGRQRIALDDERFVGAANFRQNGQTFDAIRTEFQPITGVKADVSYAWGVRTVWGMDGTGARARSVGGNFVLSNLSVSTPVGTVTGFGYLVDEDEQSVQGYRLASQTYGARLAGAHAFSASTKLSYLAAFARQSDYDRNPNRYTADYYALDAALALGGPMLGAGYEVLGADNGVALTSFQTPLGSVFKFQGWADKFTTTPPDGVRDLYGSAGYTWKQVGPMKGVSVQAIYHRFDSDRLVRHYGNEIDLLASAKLGRTTASVRFADYRADRFATDTRKLWLELDWAI